MSQELRDELGNYHIGGKKYKSITTILKEEMPHMALDAWKERTPNWPSIGKKAAIYGTFMHMKIQELVTGTHPEVPKDFKLSEWCDMEMALELDDRVEQWMNLGLNIGTPNITEHTVVIERHDEDGIVMAAGTLDYFGPVDGMVVIGDWKSSKRPQESHRIQLGAYYLGMLAEGKEAQEGQIWYIRRNNADIIELEKDELEEEGEKFLELGKRSYARMVS